MEKLLLAPLGSLVQRFIHFRTLDRALGNQKLLEIRLGEIPDTLIAGIVRIDEVYRQEPRAACSAFTDKSRRLDGQPVALILAQVLRDRVRFELDHLLILVRMIRHNLED